MDHTMASEARCGTPRLIICHFGHILFGSAWRGVCFILHRIASHRTAPLAGLGEKARQGSARPRFKFNLGFPEESLRLRSRRQGS